MARCRIRSAVGGSADNWPAAIRWVALLAGSARTCFGIFAAGIASAEDPVHTVVPRRGDVRQNSERKEPR
jgi:hypothetical protein